MAVWGHVQSAQKNETSNNSTLAFAGNVVAGNIIVIGIRLGGVSQLPVVSDTLGNAYAKVLETNYSSDTLSLITFIAFNTLAGANTVTLTNTDSILRRWVIAEYTGPTWPGAVIDQVAAATGSSTALDSGNITTEHASELLLGIGACNSSRSFTAGTNFTEQQEVAQKMSVEDRSVAVVGTYSSSFALSSTATDWCCQLVTIGVRSRPTGMMMGMG